jgi:dTDP-4-amino-4,6-dideoxygalactose transaminase
MTNSLAINGGKPIRSKPWLEGNSIGKEEKEAAIRVIDGKRLSLFQGAYTPPPPYSFLGGPEVQSLEAMARDMIGAKHVVSVNSATSGLYAAVGALGLGYGDEVITSPYTMSACAMAPLLYGAIPVFADVVKDTTSLDPASIRKCITERTKAILVVHQFGIPAQMDEIMEIAKEHKLKVIEDCAQAWGAKFKGKHVGTFGNVGVFSFNVHKTVQCGEGGLCVTNDDETAKRLQMIRNHGEAVTEPANYTKIENIIGFNYRLTEIQAAIAKEQLKKLPKLNERRVEMVHALYDGMKKYPCLVAPDLRDREATFYVAPLRYLEEKCGGTSRKDFVAALAAEGIPFAAGYVKPLYMLPIFQRRLAFNHGYPWKAPENAQSKPNYAPGAAPVVEELQDKELLVNAYLCHPQTLDDIDDVLAGIDKVVSSLS